MHVRSYHDQHYSNYTYKLYILDIWLHAKVETLAIKKRKVNNVLIGEKGKLPDMKNINLN